MMRLTILVLAFGLALANYDETTPGAEATTPCPETTPGAGGEVTTPGAGAVTTPGAQYDATTPSAGGVTTPGAGYGATTPSAGGVTTPNAGGVTTPAAGGYGATTPSANGATTPGGQYGASTPAGGHSGGSTPHGGSGASTPAGGNGGGKGHFTCNRKPTGGKDILNLDPVASLENLCLDVCQNQTCGNSNNPGLLGAAQCLLNGVSSTLSPLQSCLIPCILNLNALQTCNAAVIATQLAKLCPDFQRKPLCLSVCACCALDNDPLLDVCVNACVSSDGLDVSAIAPGLLPPVNVPVKLPIKLRRR